MDTFSLDFQLYRTSRALTAAMDDQLRPLHINSPQLLILLLIERHPEVTSAHLARLAAVAPQTMHRSLQTLERNQLISKQAKQGDDKSLYIALTPQGKRILRQGGQRVKKVQTVTMQGLGLEELQIMQELLRKYEQILQRMEGAKYED